MRAKEFFRSVIRAERELMVIRAQIRHFHDLGTRISGGSMDSPVVTHSLGQSRVESAAMGLYDKAQELDKKALEFLVIIQQAEEVIAEIPQEKYRQILSLRYLSGWSLRSISDELGYKDEKSIFRAHGWALSEAQKVLNKKEKAAQS